MIALAAITNNFVMGQKSNTDLPWPKQKDDLSWFKEMTMGKNLLVGPKTFNTIRHLKGRNFYVFVNDEITIQQDNVLGVVNFELLAEEQQKKFDSDDMVLAGGSWLYAKLLAKCTKLYLTIFDFSLDLGENALYFPWSNVELRNLFPKQREYRRVENGTIFEYSR